MLMYEDSKILDYGNILLDHISNNDLKYLFDNPYYCYDTLHFNLKTKKFQSEKTHETFLTVKSGQKATKELFVESIIKKTETQLTNFTRDFLKLSAAGVASKVKNKEWPIDYLYDPREILDFLRELHSKEPVYISEYVSDVITDFVKNTSSEYIENSEKIHFLNFASYELCKDFYDDIYSNIIKTGIQSSEDAFSVNKKLTFSDMKKYLIDFEKNNLFYYILKFEDLSKYLSISVKVDNTFLMKCYNRGKLKQMISNIQFDGISVNEILNFKNFPYTSLYCSTKTHNDIKNFLNVYRTNLSNDDVHFLKRITINDSFKNGIDWGIYDEKTIK